MDAAACVTESGEQPNRKCLSNGVCNTASLAFVHIDRRLKEERIEEIATQHRERYFKTRNLTLISRKSSYFESNRFHAVASASTSRIPGNESNMYRLFPESFDLLTCRLHGDFEIFSFENDRSCWIS